MLSIISFHHREVARSSQKPDPEEGGARAGDEGARRAGRGEGSRERGGEKGSAPRLKTNHRLSLLR